MKIRYPRYIKHILLFISSVLICVVSNAQYYNNSNIGWSIYLANTFSGEIVDDANVKVPINYVYGKINNNDFKQGPSIGLKYDGVFSEKSGFTISFGVNAINTGTFYKNKYTISPFIEELTHFKADDQFTTLNIATHYKYLLPIADMDNYKFYGVFGPSFDYKISNISPDHLVSGANDRTFLNIDFGLEFDNKSYYVLYLHGKKGTNPTNSTVPIKLNRLELGLAVKLRDIF
jgi:hypothetical protein